MRPVSEPEKKAETRIKNIIRPNRTEIGMSFSKEDYASKTGKKCNYRGQSVECQAASGAEDELPHQLAAEIGEH
jgi:hypothetical protein